MTPGQEQRQGWGWPRLARKPHYFIGTRSLCGKWAYAGELAPNDGETLKDDCAVCTRELAAMQARKPKPKKVGVELTPDADMSGAVNTGGIPHADHAVKTPDGRVFLKAGKGKGETTTRASQRSAASQSSKGTKDTKR